jgi:signal transduction histidine kinase/DNA-binding response OmpR family regulator
MKPMTEIAHHPACILIVDDERHNRALLEVMLAPEGFLLLTAANGEEAIATVARQPPDLILLDIMMPGMNGYQVAEKIKGDPATKQIPIIMVTALHDREAMMLGLAAGAEDFLTKPVYRAELCMRVRNLLRLKAYGDHFNKYSQTLEDEVSSRTVDLAESDHEKQYMRLLQTVADEALRAPEAPIKARLEELLELILQAMDARSAALVLYEPQTERVITAASAGVASEEMERLATLMVLWKERPNDAEAQAIKLILNDALRQNGIQSLQGIRLPPHHKLFGVLYIGLHDDRSLTKRELRRLQALGDRLTLHLDNAKLYTDLRQQVEELGIERELRERFVSILAHDLRGPLATAKMSSALMIRRTDPLDERRGLADRIERNLERMDRMIRDLLDVSRVRGGQRLPLRLDRCDLGAVAKEVIEELSAAHGDRFELAQSDGILGIWSHQELHRALWNLGTNAVKYGVSDRPITTRIERTPEGVRASVHNFGNPIPTGKRDRLFDLYSRLREGSGTGWGLGLALVRACAEAHGGQVSIGESSEEAGTTFMIDLPSDSRPFQPSEPRMTEHPGALVGRSDDGPS